MVYFFLHLPTGGSTNPKNKLWDKMLSIITEITIKGDSPVQRIFPYYFSTLYFTLLESKKVQNYLKEGCKSMCAAFKKTKNLISYWS